MTSEDLSAVPSPEFRAALLTATTRVITRRRRWRRVRAMSLLLVVYGAGIATARFWLRPHDSAAVSTAMVAAAPTAAPQADPVPVPTAVPPRPVVTRPEESPLVITGRPRPARPREPAAVALKHAADEKLRTHGDLAAAARLYAGALEAGLEESRDAPTDHWLFRALRRARNSDEHVTITQ